MKQYPIPDLNHLLAQEAESSITHFQRTGTRPDPRIKYQANPAVTDALLAQPRQELLRRQEIENEFFASRNANAVVRIQLEKRKGYAREVPRRNCAEANRFVRSNPDRPGHAWAVYEKEVTMVRPSGVELRPWGSWTTQSKTKKE